jgi:hypothetical protein
MLFRFGFVLLSVWLIGVAGVYNVGDLVHALLLSSRAAAGIRRTSAPRPASVAVGITPTSIG